MLRKKTPTSSYSVNISSMHWKAERDIICSLAHCELNKHNHL